MPVLLLGLLLPFVLLVLVLAMERVEEGLGDDAKDAGNGHRKDG